MKTQTREDPKILASAERQMQAKMQSSSNGIRSGWPLRRHYLLVALFITVVAVYGSLVPLRYRALGFHEAIERFKEIPYLSLGVGSRADWVANILLFIPISYCWLAVLMVDRRLAGLSALAVPLVVLLSAVLSMALEFTQLWFPPRTVSQNDVIAEIIGAAIGAVVWLVIGQTITDWLRCYTIEQRPKRQIDWLLEAYLIGLLLYSVLPLDLTISPAELVHKYRAGKICLIPFSDIGRDFVTLYGLFRDVAVFIPVGMLAATWLTAAERPVRPMPTSVLLGGLVVLGIELVQLLVYSRFTSTGDLITGTFGVWVGAWVMRRWRVREGEHQPQFASARSVKRAWFWLGLAGVYSLFLIVVFCAPFESIDDPQQIRARFDGFLCVPFASLYRGTEFNAISEILKKGLFYGPLGAFFALAVVPLAVPRPIRRILLAGLLMVAAGIATSIEMAQVFLPPHVPDVTDVILCTAGAAVAMFVTARIVDRRRG